VSDAAGADVEQAIIQRLVRRRLCQDGLAHLGEAGFDVVTRQYNLPLGHDLGCHEGFFHRDTPDGHDHAPWVIQSGPPQIVQAEADVDRAALWQ
jgi:hypothetical protein